MPADQGSVQRLRRIKQLTHGDLAALGEVLHASGAGQQVDITWASEQHVGLGLIVRSRVGLDRQAASNISARYLDGTKVSVDELTANGAVEPSRRFESPYTDHAPSGPDLFFPEADVAVIAEAPYSTSSRPRRQPRTSHTTPAGG